MPETVTAQIVETPTPERPDLWVNLYQNHLERNGGLVYLNSISANQFAVEDRTALFLLPGDRRLAAMKRLQSAMDEVLRVCREPPRTETAGDLQDAIDEYDFAQSALAEMDRVPHE